jgi:hypothetical protein
VGSVGAGFTDRPPLKPTIPHPNLPTISRRSEAPAKPAKPIALIVGAGLGERRSGCDNVDRLNPPVPEDSGKCLEVARFGGGGLENCAIA